MASYLGIAVYVGNTGSTTSDVNNWSNRKPTYITYTGNSTARSLSSGGWLTSLYTDNSGKKYAVWIVNIEDSSSSWFTYIIQNIGTSWCHNDSASYAYPSDYSVNVDHIKDVYTYKSDTPFTNISVSGYTIQCAWKYDSYWNQWKASTLVGWKRELANRITSPALVDYPYESNSFNGPGSSGGTSIIELKCVPGTYGASGQLLITTNTTIGSTDNSNCSGHYLYDFSSGTITDGSSKKAQVSGNNTTVFALHNAISTDTFYIGYNGNITSSNISSNPSYGYYYHTTSGFDTWTNYISGNKRYLSITAITKSGFYGTSFPVQLGKKYNFSVRTNAATNYNGVVIAKGELAAPSTGNTYLTNLTWTNQGDVLYRRAGYLSSADTTYAYTPSADGNVYVYFRARNNDTIGYTYLTSGLADVRVDTYNADPVTVTLNDNGGAGGSGSVQITPGTPANQYPDILPPARSGYIFLGYYDAQTGGTAYYNSLCQATKVFDKVGSTTLYAHWQQESAPTLSITLNDNGGSGGQGTTSVASGQMIGTVVVPVRPGFTFLGYYNKYNTAPGGSGQYQYVDATGTGCKTISSTIQLYALWQNDIVYNPTDEIVGMDGGLEYSPSSQTINIANTAASAGAGTLTITGVFEGNAITISDGGKKASIPAGVDAGQIYNLTVKITSATSLTSGGYIGITNKEYDVYFYVDWANIVGFDIQGASVAANNTAQAKVKTPVAGTLYWGWSSSTMTTTQNITTTGSYVNITNATNSSNGTTKTVYGYFYPTNNNYNPLGGPGNPDDEEDLIVAAAVSTTVTITLNNNGGSGGSGSIVVEKNSNCSTWPSVSVPTRAGFTFMGYYTVSAATGGDRVYYETGEPYYGYSTSSNVTLYARWKINISYTHNNISSETATEQFVSMAAGEATSTTSTVTFQIDGGQIDCVASSWTISILDSDKTSWTINSTGTTFTVPSGTSYTYSPSYFRWKIVVADGTYNSYPYVGNTLTASYSFDPSGPRPIYYYLKKVEYVKDSNNNIIKYKAINGAEGYNITSTATPGSGTISGYYQYATDNGWIYASSVTNETSWYQKYTNGTWDTTLKTGERSVYPVWRIMSETFTRTSDGQVSNIERAHAGSIAVSSQLLIDGVYRTVYRSSTTDGTFVHGSMEKNLGTDTVTIRFYNPDDPSKYSEKTASTTNTLSSTQYTTSACTTQGYASFTANNPTVTIESGMTAAGGTGNITCICNDTASWYQKYSSNAYEFYQNQSVTSTAYWRISSQTCVGGTDRFTMPTASNYNSTTLNVGGTDYTCYKTNYKVTHASMTTNEGTDSVTIIAYREDDTTKSGTATESITNELLPTHYKNSTCTTEGNYSSTYGTPSTVTIGDGLTAAGGSATVSGGTCSDTFQFYKKYTSGSKTGRLSETVDSTITWSLSTHTFTPSGGSAADTDRFTLSNGTVTHTTMGTNVGTDKVVVRATNANSTTKYKDSSAKSITNSLISTHYKDSACTQTGENISTYGTPTASIGDGLTAAGGSATVTCTVNNTGSWYQKYDSGSVATYTNQSVSGTARWNITNNGNSRFSHPSSGGTTLSGVGTVYNTGTKVSHSTMGTNAVTDSVTITSYNIGDTSKTKTASKSVTNSLGTTKYKNTSGTEGYNITYNAPTSVTIGSGLSASGGSTTVTIGSFTNSTSWYQKYDSGSYTSLQTGTEAATAKWRITDEDCDGGGFWVNGTGSSLSIGGSTYTVYNSGAELRHSSMYISYGTDHVSVTAYNIGDTTKSKSAGCDVDNDIDYVHLNVKKTTIKYDEVTYCEAMAQYTSGCFRPVPSEDLTYTMGTSGKISITSTPATESIYIQIDDFDDINYENEGYQSLTDWVSGEYDYSGYWYKYVEEIEYDGETYYLWAFDDYAGIDAYIESDYWHAYVITDTKNATTLYNYSLASTLQNLYVYPLVAVLNNDLDDTYWNAQTYCIINVIS